MNPNDMNQGVKLLGARMESNPEEFAEGEHKWAKIVNAVIKCVERKDVDTQSLKISNFLTNYELDYLLDKLNDARRENFTATVINTLMQGQAQLNFTTEDLLTPSDIKNLRNQLVARVKI
jgi:hypothetical protein